MILVREFIILIYMNNQPFIMSVNLSAYFYSCDETEFFAVGRHLKL